MPQRCTQQNLTNFEAISLRLEPLVVVNAELLGLATGAPVLPSETDIDGRSRQAEKCHVWTAPAVQEESDISAKRSGAAMYPAFECSRYGRWP